MCARVTRGGTARRKAAYGQGSGPILMDDVFCAGNENKFGECYFVTGLDVNCDHSEDASVECGPAGAQTAAPPPTTTPRPGVTQANNCSSGKDGAKAKLHCYI